MDMRLGQRVWFPCGNSAILAMGTHGFYLQFAIDGGVKKYLNRIKSRDKDCFSPETDYGTLMRRLSRIKGVYLEPANARVFCSRSVSPCHLRFNTYTGLVGTRDIIKRTVRTF